MAIKNAIIVLFVLLCALCFAVALVSCSHSDENEDVNIETNAPIPATSGYGYGGIICTPTAFERAKDNWYRVDRGSLLLSDSANATRATELNIGEEYYFVYTYRGAGDNRTSDKNLYSHLKFYIRTAGKIYYNQEAVTFKNFSYDESDVTITYSAPTTLNITRKKLNQDVSMYYIIEFTPNYSGTLYVESLVWPNKFYKYKSETHHVTFANVYEDQRDSIVPVKISNIKITGLAHINVGTVQVVNINFDITSLVENRGTALIYCGINFSDRNLIGVNIDEVNTGNVYQGNYISESSNINGHEYITYGKLYDIGYRIPEKGTKHVDISFSITSSGLGESTLRLFFFGDEILISGQTYSVIQITPEYTVSEDKGVQTDGDLVYTYSTNGYTVKGFSTSIGESLYKIVIPEMVNDLPVIAIGANAFKDTAVREVTMGNTVQLIGAQAFYGCRLTKVNLSNNLKKIDTQAFSSCKLSEIALPEGLIEIGAEAFSHCDNLEQITLPGSLTTIGPSAFKESALISIHIPRNVTTIGEDAFALTNIYSVNIPENVSSIGAGAFRNCNYKRSLVQKITVDEKNPHYKLVDGVLFNSDMTVLVAYPQDGNRNHYEIPDGVKEIMPYAFNQIASAELGFPGGALKTITLPASVEKIGEYAFSVDIRYHIKYSSDNPYGFYSETMTNYDSVAFLESSEWIVGNNVVSSLELTGKDIAILLSEVYYNQAWIRNTIN